MVKKTYDELMKGIQKQATVCDNCNIRNNCPNFRKVFICARDIPY